MDDQLLLICIILGRNGDLFKWMIPFSPMAKKRGRAGAKASGKAKSSVYNVFGGASKHSAPLPVRREEYAEIFGGLASKCSIPYLDLPPAMRRIDGGPSGDRSGGRNGGAGGIDYNEVFAGVDFGQVGVSYEELVSDKKREEKNYAKESLVSGPVSVFHEEELLSDKKREEKISLQER